ncbi:MAG: hypothetical protein ACR2HG_01570 [Pyrinomonadaceae bacterium]
MNDVEIKFERENLCGIVAVGTYLADAAARMGVDLENDLASEKFGETDYFVMKIKQGAELLSAPTKTELEYLSAERRKHGERISNQAKIERAGEITVMTTKKKEAEKPAEEAKQEEYRKEFQDLPLEKKIANLLELEAIALSETFTFVLNSPYKIVDMALGVLAQFGLKMEDETKKQSRPDEHQTEKNESETSHKKTKHGKKAEAN